jgi:hypothetical protein
MTWIYILSGLFTACTMYICYLVGHNHGEDEAMKKYRDYFKDL